MTERICTKYTKYTNNIGLKIKYKLITVLKQHTVNKIPIAQMARDNA